MKKTHLDRYPSGFSRKATAALFHYRAHLQHRHNIQIIIEDMDTNFQVSINKGPLQIAYFYGMNFLDLASSLIGFSTGFRAYEKIIKEDIK